MRGQVANARAVNTCLLTNYKDPNKYNQNKQEMEKPKCDLGQQSLV